MTVKRRSSPRVSKTDYRPFPELVIAGDRQRIYAWQQAAHEFEYGHPQPLADLLASRSRIPAFVRKLLADSITGKLKIRRKGASNRKLSLSDRMRVRFHHGIQTPRGEKGALKSVDEIATSAHGGNAGARSRTGWHRRAALGSRP
jgi:hypothetical protein